MLKKVIHMPVPASNAITKILAKRKAIESSLSFLSDKRQVLIYGAGNSGKELLDLLLSKGVFVKGFLDGIVAEGAKVNGYEVYRPDTHELEQDQRNKYCVVISIFNVSVDIKPIQENLLRCGYETIVTFLELYRHFPSELGNRLWLTDPSFYNDCEPFLADALSLWEDESSRNIFKEVLDFRCSFDYAVLPQRTSEKQYFDTTIPKINASRYVDCGAYDGDTIQTLCRHADTIEAVAAFEPDLNNFVALSNKVRKFKQIKQATLFPCGVWSKASQLSFLGALGTSSNISAAGDTTICCVALDEVLVGFKPTYIKMDIEGAEFSALLGAQQIIKTDRPALAICLYHKPEHLWQIPLLIKSWNLEYTFYLRVYEYLGQELVMYAIPAT